MEPLKLELSLSVIELLGNSVNLCHGDDVRLIEYYCQSRALFDASHN